MLVRDALRVIASDPARPFELDDVAREIACSRRSLQRAFESQGITFRQAVTVARIHRARTMLAEGDLAVKSVCEAVGYRSKAEFAKAFRRHTGVTPSKYKREMRDRRRAAVQGPGWISRDAVPQRGPQYA